MDKEEAQSYIGKTVYTVDYEKIMINQHEVLDSIEDYNHNGTVYQLRDTNKDLLWSFKDTFEKAHLSLVRYWEMQQLTIESNLDRALQFKLQE